MATLVEEAMESYAFPAAASSSYFSSNPYSYRYPTPHPHPPPPPPPKGKGGPGSWRPRGGGGGGYFSGYGEAPTATTTAAVAAAAAAAAEYFDNYQRAQLKAILSQVNPNLTPRLRKANTKEVGVQVNPRQDASVQCSLGPRPLLPRRPQEQGGAGGGAAPASTPARSVRFPRTIAVYSPVASRRLTTFVEEEPSETQEGRESGGGGEEEAPADKEKKPDGKPPQIEATEEEEAASASEETAKPVGGEAEAGQKQRGAEEGPQASAGKAEATEESGQSKARVRFQFLEQKYGYYHCKDCNIRWESAYVWCVQGTNKVYFRQFCRTCQKSYNPYRVEDITCQSCKQTRCTCPVKLRHVDPKRPHRQDLCGRCKGKRLSCDSTFSFKYII